MAGTFRVNRIREQMLREFADIVPRLKDPQLGMVNIVDVEVTRDLRFAKLFVSVMGDPSARRDSMAALSRATAFVRRELGKRLSLRYVPELRIEYDDSAERASHISRVLDNARVSSNDD